MGSKSRDREKCREMERNREARRVPMATAAAGNGFSRRRLRAGSFRESPEEESPVEFPEAARLRDWGASTKKDRERDREREREKEKERDRLNSRSKRRRGERLIMMQRNIDDGGGGEDEDDDTSEESVNDDEEYVDGGAMKMLPPAMKNHHNGSGRKSFPPTKNFRSSPSPTPPPASSPIVSSWKAADEMIGVSVPRKARSASTKRSHESWTTGGGVFSPGVKIHRQISSPASLLASPSPPAPPSPSPSTVLVRKKITPGSKQKPLPPKSPVTAAQDEIEIEIAEVLYGMMRQPSKQETVGNDSGEISNNNLHSAKPTVEVKSRSSSPSPIFNLQIAPPLAIAPKRKRPRLVKYEEDTLKAENEGRFAGENLSVMDSTKESSVAEKKLNGFSKEEKQSPEMESSCGIRSDGDVTITLRVKASLPSPEKEKIEINLMTRSSPARDGGDIECMVKEAKPKVTIMESETKFLPELIVKPKDRNPRTSAEDEPQNLDKSDPDIISVKHHVNKQLSGSDRAAQASPLPLHMSIPGWPGGISAMGYLEGPTQSVIPADASSLPSTTMQPPHLLFNQPRPKRCATHCYIARNIHYHQQITKMNPFWPTVGGSAPLYGSKACNLSLMPSAELQGSVMSRSSNIVNEKSSQSTLNTSDTAQRKQILLQQALPPGAGTNIMHGPTFIFPIGQQPHAAAAIAAASVRPPNIGNTVVSSGAVAASASMNGSASVAPAGGQAMSFSYPNMPTNETQYLAILQNNGYPFPVPAHVGAPPAYRGVAGQPMPFFNGSFYPSQMVHTPHLQPQQQCVQGQQTHAPSNQNTHVSTSAAQKQLQNQQRRQPVNTQGISTQKVQSQPLSLQHRHQPRENANQHSETAREDSPSTGDGRTSHSSVAAYGQNFALPIQPTNMGTMGSEASGDGVVSSSNNHGEKKPELQVSKTGAESIQSQPYAMTFATFNGGQNMPPIAQNHAIFHGVPETAMQGYHQMIAAAVTAQSAKQKMNYSGPEDGKSGSNATEERKTTGANTKTTVGVGQSITFSSKQDSADASASPVTGGNIIDSSARLLNLGSAQSWSSNSAPISQQQHIQRNHPQQQQYSNYLQMQQQYAVAAARGKGPVTSSGGVFPDHNVATATPGGANITNATSGFPQNLVHSGSGSPAQSPQWKNNSPRANTMAQAQPPSMLSPSASSSQKSLQQKHQGRPHQSQISFAANSRTLPSNSPMQQGAGGANQAPSPSTSSVSKSTGGSPRTMTSNSMANKTGLGRASSATLSSSQPSKNSQSASSAGGRNNGPSILGNPHITTPTSNPTSKSQQQHLQQAQLYFSSPYMQPQHHQQQQMTMSPAVGYYIQRNQQQAGSSGAATSVTLSSCATVTSDPSKAINMKGGGNNNNNNLQHSQTAGKTHQQQQIGPPGFPLVHAGQVKPGDQKQQAGE